MNGKIIGGALGVFASFLVGVFGIWFVTQVLDNITLGTDYDMITTMMPMLLLLVFICIVGASVWALVTGFKARGYGGDGNKKRGI